MIRALVLFLATAAMALSLTACGRRADPRPPEGVEYPHVYPRSPDQTEIVRQRSPQTGPQTDEDEDLPQEKTNGSTPFGDLHHDKATAP